MKEHPIVFSGPMIRAIVEGRKTMTRRMVKPQPIETKILGLPGLGWQNMVWAIGDKPRFPTPYGQPGDVLWVKETWGEHPDDGGILYRATDPGWDDNDTGLKWRSPRFMPRWASRLTLKITDIRVERLQDTSEVDAEAEGVFPEKPKSRGAFDSSGGYTFLETLSSYREGFKSIWNSINSKRGFDWDKNPLVWVIEFKVTPQVKASKKGLTQPCCAK